MQNKQTAVEWLDNQLSSLRLKLRTGEIDIPTHNAEQISIVFKALKMECQQLEDKYRDGFDMGTRFEKRFTIPKI